MEKVKNVTKSGWHPSGKDGKKESWRGDFKGINQVAGWVGKGKNPQSEASEHQSRPLASLRNPESFGPPPKNINFHSGDAVPAHIPPKRSDSRVPLNNDDTQAAEEEHQQEARAAEEVEMRRGVSVSYRADTTGPTTNNLPKPPVRQFGNEIPLDTSQAISIARSKPKPSLPPRLPPRQGKLALQQHASPPPPYFTTPPEEITPNSGINQGALKRLGSAGISVPGFGIGGGSVESNPWQNQRSLSNEKATSDKSVNQGSQISGLQTRFSQISVQSSTAETPSQGTTLAQKQAAFKTASSFRNDPASVSLADAKSTVSTANNFRERHGDQVADGWKKSNDLNKKYNLMDKFNNYASDGTHPPQTEAGSTAVTSDANDQSMLSSKRKPPPPPPKRSGSSSAASSPPPIPLASKPR